MQALEKLRLLHADLEMFQFVFRCPKTGLQFSVELEHLFPLQGHASAIMLTDKLKTPDEVHHQLFLHHSQTSCTLLTLSS